MIEPDEPTTVVHALMPPPGHAHWAVPPQVRHVAVGYVFVLVMYWRCSRPVARDLVRDLP